MYNIYFCLLFLVICLNHTFVVRSSPLLLFGILESIRHISPKHLDASGVLRAFHTTEFGSVEYGDQSRYGPFVRKIKSPYD